MALPPRQRRCAPVLFGWLAYISAAGGQLIPMVVRALGASMLN